MMKRSQIPRFFTDTSGKLPRLVRRMFVLGVVLGLLGVVVAQTQLFGTTQSSSGSLYSSISQSIQAGMSSSGISLCGPNGTQSSSVAIGDGWATGQVCIGTQTCPCPTTCTSEPAPIAKPCDPFEGLIGKWITIQLDGGVTVSGMLEKECRGFLILRGQGLTLTVNIQKILFIESR